MLANLISNGEDQYLISHKLGLPSSLFDLGFRITGYEQETAPHNIYSEEEILKLQDVLSDHIPEVKSLPKKPINGRSFKD